MYDLLSRSPTAGQQAQEERCQNDSKQKKQDSAGAHFSLLFSFSF